MKKEFSGVNKVHKEGEFETKHLSFDSDVKEGVVKATGLEDLTYIKANAENNELINYDNFNQIYQIKMENAEKEDILNVIEALSDDASLNIAIVNCSYGGYHNFCDYCDADMNALSNYSNILVVCAAGNNKIDTDVQKHYPSCYENENIISVGASTIDDKIATGWGTNGDEGSNWGATTVDYKDTFMCKCVTGGRLNAYAAVNKATKCKDGSYILYNGNVYKIVGGAPLYVSNWNVFGGVQPCTSVDYNFFKSLNKYPKDGTYISAAGQIYRFAGGTPLYVSDWNKMNGDTGPIYTVDPIVLNCQPEKEPLCHTNEFPKDRTCVRTKEGYYYMFCGGSPIYMTSMQEYKDNNVFPAIITLVDNSALGFNSDLTKNKIRSYPSNGIRVRTKNKKVYAFAGGTPFLANEGVEDIEKLKFMFLDSGAIDRSVKNGPHNHVTKLPVEKIQIVTEKNNIYEIDNGNVRYLKKADASRPIVRIDSVCIDFTTNRIKDNY